MDAVSAASTASSIQAVNDVLKMASQESVKTAKKLLAAETEMKVGSGTVSANSVNTYA
jgi:hypothetical protein